MTTLISPTYATPETQIYQSYKKQHDRKRRKSHNPGFIVSYPYVTNFVPGYLDPENWAVADPDGSVINTEIDNPSDSNIAGLCSITSGNLTILTTFSSFNSLSGEKIYMCLIVKNIDAENIFVRFQSDAGIADQTQVSLTTLSKVTGGSNILTQDLSNGFSLLQIEYVTISDLINADVLVYLNGDGGSVYLQAAFFGKADDFPANVMPTL